LRDLFRAEVRCQIIHDSIHRRPGWTHEYVLRRDGVTVGYGSVAVAGPWKERPAVYEFCVVPDHRSYLFDLFEAFSAASAAPAIEVQTNDVIAAVVLHAYARDVAADAILFHDSLTTHHPLPPNVTIRTPTATEAPDSPSEDLRWRVVVDADGEVVAAGGVLLHYNPPYGDIYMDVDERFRRRGFGTVIVQELKRVCYERGFIPGARCSVHNIASRSTLQRAGFVPCGHILTGLLR
jgi:GNAT superfamily N-acetyltransferase